MPHRLAYLERLGGADRHVVSKHPLDASAERHFVGRAADSWLRLQLSPLARKHLKLEYGPLGRWWMDSLGSTNGVWVNRTHYGLGRRMLEPGDLLRITSGQTEVALRYGVEGWRPLDAKLREAIDADPSDDARWLVWADFLEEQGDPIAQRIRGGGPSPGDLGVAAGHDWRHGFISRGHLHRGGRALAFLRRELEQLLGNPFARWMQSLQVDVDSYLAPPHPPGAGSNPTLEVLSVLEVLTREQPAALTALRFELKEPPGPRVRQTLAGLQLMMPRLRCDLEVPR